MNLKVYEKTRYQNIYRHRKNKNLVIAISKPIKTSISDDLNGNKIFDIDVAIKLRDNPKKKLQKAAEIACNGLFDDYWQKYMEHCNYELKLAYNTMTKKRKVFNTHLKGKFKKKLPKITREEISKIIDQLDTTDKQKNEVLDEVKAFFRWCKYEEYIINNPAEDIKKYKVTKTEMKYWSSDNLKQFLDYLDYEIKHSKKKKQKEIAYRVKLITILGVILGDRPGETRALTFSSFDKENKKVNILHSINYDRDSDDYLSTTKTYGSQRDFFITLKLLSTITDYRIFLENELGYKIYDNSLILWNYETKKPFSDCTLRNNFYELCKKANVPHIRLYDLRHTFAALMMEEGVELYQISSQMGHTNFSTTVNQYGHISDKIKKGNAKITDKFY